MFKGLKEDKTAFAAVSLLAITISMLALAANSFFVRYGGYAAGAAASGILLAVLCFVYSQTSDVIKKRTRDMFFCSMFIVTMYFIFTLLVDISQLSLASFTGITGMGITVLVFVGLFWAIGIWEIIRLIFDIFGISLRKYEDFLAGNIPFIKKKAKDSAEPDFYGSDTSNAPDISDSPDAADAPDNQE